MIHTLSLSLTMMVVWLFWSGHYTGLLIGLGAVSSVLVACLARHMSLADPEGHPIHLAGGGLLYSPWLIWAVIKSSLEVTRLILSRDMKIHPCIMQVHATQTTDLARAVYANSITLTPGTVTVDIEGDCITVHALTEAAAADLATGDMDRRVTRMEGAG